MRRVFSITLCFVPLLALLCLTSGCEKGTPPEADHLTAQVTQQFFQALENNDLAAAELTAKRLQDLHPEQDRFSQMRDGNLLGLRLQVVSHLLVAGRLGEAEQVLRVTQKELRAQPELIQALELTTALQALARYRRAQPFKNSKDATVELDLLLAHASPLEGSLRFNTWLGGERVAIAAQSQQEIYTRYRELADEYGRRLLAGTADPLELAKPLRDLILDDATLERARHHLLVTDASTLESMVSDSERLKTGSLLANPDLGTALEIAFVRAWPSFTPRIRSEVALLDLPASAASTAGLLLRARVAVVRGNPSQAAQWTRKLLAQQSLSPALNREGIDLFLLPADQTTGGEWQRPYPTVTDLFKRLDRLRIVESRSGTP